MAFCAPNIEYATSSLIAMRVPSRLPTARQSFHGTPITNAIGAKITPKILFEAAGETRRCG